MRLWRGDEIGAEVSCSQSVGAERAETASDSGARESGKIRPQWLAPRHEKLADRPLAAGRAPRRENVKANDAAPATVLSRPAAAPVRPLSSPLCFLLPLSASSPPSAVILLLAHPLLLHTISSRTPFRCSIVLLSSQPSQLRVAGPRLSPPFPWHASSPSRRSPSALIVLVATTSHCL